MNSYLNEYLNGECPETAVNYILLLCEAGYSFGGLHTDTLNAPFTHEGTFQIFRHSDGDNVLILYRRHQRLTAVHFHGYGDAVQIVTDVIDS